MGLKMWEKLLGCHIMGWCCGGCTYDYRGVPVGDEGVVVAFCIAERGVAGLGDEALEMVWGCDGEYKRTSVAICFSRVSATGWMAC